jgi:hypothetical protein
LQLLNGEKGIAMSHLLFSFILAAGAAALPLDGGSGSGTPPPGEHHHHGPPQEAIAACANLKADDACSFKINDHDISGTCKAHPDNANQLACRPEHPPHHDHGG